MAVDFSDGSTNQPSTEPAVQPGWRGKLLRVFFLINRFWWIILVCVLLGVGIQAVILAFEPSKYRSVGKMILNGRISVPQQGEDVYSEDLMMFYGTQVALMKSGEIYSQAIERVRSLNPDVAVDEYATVDAFQEPKTSVFDLTSVSTNPEYAKDLLEAVMETYQSSKRQVKGEATDTALAAITEEINKLDKDIHTDEQQLLDFQKENNVVFIEEQSSDAAKYLVSLNDQIASLKKEYDLLSLEKESRGTAGTTNQPSDFPADGATQQADANIAAEQENIAKLKILRDQYGQYLKDKHPKMIAFTNAIEKEQKFLDILKSRDAALQESHRNDLSLQIQNLQKQLDEWNKKSLDMNQRLEIFEELKAKIAREENLYSQAATSVQHVDLSKSLDQDEVRTMSHASPGLLIDPNYPLQFAIGSLGGLLFSAILIFLIDKLDNRINSPLDFEDNFEIPILGQIPIARIDPKTKRVPLLTENDPRHLLGESYRNIRSSLLFRPTGGGSRPRSILITSSVPGEGKSTMASNLAASLAFSGLRVLLVDADLRRGVLHKIINPEGELGLSEYLQGQVGWKEAVQSTVIPNLSLIVRGKIPKNAGELLLSYPMDVLLSESVAEYDMVIWDSAPILATDDVGNLCSSMDSVIVVFRTGFSTFDSVTQALDEITHRGGKVLGVAANAVKATQPGYKNKYRYNEYNVVSKS